MKISFLCSDVAHSINARLQEWIAKHSGTYASELVRKKSELSGGDILFLISCTEIISAADRARYRATLVLHASDLPRGRGWSPHIWQILEGEEEITLSLLEAADRVDSGRIWKKLKFPVSKDALWDEINSILFDAEIDLINFAMLEFENIEPIEQDADIEPTYYPRRSPSDSRIDPFESIANQFNKIRVCDPERYPAFFDLNGKRYKLILEKLDDQTPQH